jgi:hypothetical protein
MHPNTHHQWFFCWTRSETRAITCIACLSPTAPHEPEVTTLASAWAAHGRTTNRLSSNTVRDLEGESLGSAGGLPETPRASWGPAPNAALLKHDRGLHGLPSCFRENFQAAGQSCSTYLIGGLILRSMFGSVARSRVAESLQ